MPLTKQSYRNSQKKLCSPNIKLVKSPKSHDSGQRFIFNVPSNDENMEVAFQKDVSVASIVGGSQKSQSNLEDLKLDKNVQEEGFDLAVKRESRRFIKIQTMKMGSEGEEKEEAEAEGEEVKEIKLFNRQLTQKKQAAVQERRCVLHPQSYFKQWWNVLMILLIL